MTALYNAQQRADRVVRPYKIHVHHRRKAGFDFETASFQADWAVCGCSRAYTVICGYPSGHSLVDTARHCPCLRGIFAYALLLGGVLLAAAAVGLFHRTIYLRPVFFHILAAPMIYGREYRLDASAKVREGILHFRRDNGIHRAHHQTVTFQFAQLLCQHFWRGLGNQFAQFSEPQSSVQQVP